MTDHPPNELDVVSDGALPSDVDESGAVAGSLREATHPSVLGLMSEFPSAVEAQTVSAGDQAVVWIQASKSLEMLRWLKNDAGLV